MQIDPPLKHAAHFPVSFLIAAAAIALSTLMWFGTDLDALVATRSTIKSAPWTILTSTLLHLDIIHLLFNLSWWWPFAARLERTWGRARLIGVVALLAVVSGTAQLAFSGPGVGLSGVVYGLVAMLAVIQHRYPLLDGLVTKRTIQLFVAWFFLCVVLTLVNVWHVGNVAHGAGAAAGWLLGRAIVATPKARAAWSAALAGVAIFSAAAASITTHWLNQPGQPTENAYLGSVALRNGDYPSAAAHLEAAHRESPADTAVTIGLGIALQKLDRHDEALALYLQVVDQDPARRADVAPAIASILFRHAYDAAQSEDFVTAHQFITDALQWQPNDRDALKFLDYVRKSLSLRSPMPTAPDEPSRSSPTP